VGLGQSIELRRLPQGSESERHRDRGPGDLPDEVEALLHRLAKGSWYTVQGRPFIYFYNAGTLRPLNVSSAVACPDESAFRAGFRRRAVRRCRGCVLPRPQHAECRRWPVHVDTLRAGKKSRFVIRVSPSITSWSSGTRSPRQAGRHRHQRRSRPQEHRAAHRSPFVLARRSDRRHRKPGTTSARYRIDRNDDYYIEGLGSPERIHERHPIVAVRELTWKIENHSRLANVDVDLGRGRGAHVSEKGRHAVRCFRGAVGWWALRSSAQTGRDGREPIVFWAGWMIGDDGLRRQSIASSGCTRSTA